MTLPRGREEAFLTAKLILAKIHVKLECLSRDVISYNYTMRNGRESHGLSRVRSLQH